MSLSLRTVYQVKDKGLQDKAGCIFREEAAKGRKEQMQSGQKGHGEGHRVTDDKKGVGVERDQEWRARKGFADEELPQRGSAAGCKGWESC
jgi:hypothetical protein